MVTGSKLVHSLSSNERPHASVWVSFSMYGVDMPKLTEQQKELLSEWYSSYRKKLPIADDIETWQRYEIAGEVYRKLDYDVAFLAELYMEGSWSIRDDMVGVHRLQGPTDMIDVMKQGETELKKKLTLEQQKMILYNIFFQFINS